MVDHQTIQFWRGHLPHWEVADGRYFVTLRLAGSLPLSVLQEIDDLARRCSKIHVETRGLTRRVFRKMEAWLDHHHDQDWLIRASVPAMIADALGFYEDRGEVTVHEFVNMPNHLHVFLTPRRLLLSDFMKRFKRWTGREANRLLRRQGKRFWQTEWFDHWSRSGQEDVRICAYIRDNPVRGGLVKQTEAWLFGSWHR